MKHLKDLPNTEGFRFIGITHAGDREPCTVVHNNRFCSSVHDSGGNPFFFQLVGWEVLPSAPEGGEVGL